MSNFYNVAAATLIVEEIPADGENNRPAGLCFVENADGDRTAIGGFFATDAGWTFVRDGGELEAFAAGWDSDFPGLGTALLQWFGLSFIEGDLPFVLSYS